MNIPVLKNTFLSKFQYNRQIYEVRLKVSDIKLFLGPDEGKPFFC